MTGAAPLQPSKLERLMPWLLGLGFLALLLAEVSAWHPGYAYLDEGNQVSLIQDFREGRALPFELFKGSIHRILAAALVGALGPTLGAFRLLSLGALFLECLLLYRLALEFFGRRAALWAVAACLGSAQTFLRARSLLSFTILPLELLGMLALFGREWSWKGSALFGGFAALFVADYEGAALILPILGVFWLASRPGQRPRALAALLGYALVMLALLWLSWDGIGEHFKRRLQTMPHDGLGPARLLWLFAKSFFMGGDCIGYLGVSGRPYVAAWALPALVLGMGLAWKKNKAMLAWLAVGLLPALSIAGSSEPNRFLAAWPAICILSGLGFSWLAERTGSLALIGLMLAGLAWEARGYRQSMDGAYGHWYGESAAVTRLAKRYAGADLVDELGPEYSSQFRFLWHPAAAGGGEIFLVPQEFIPGLGKARAGLKYEPVAEGAMPLSYLDAAGPALSMRLRRVDSELRQLRQTLPRFAFHKHVQLILGYLLSGQGDPWTRTAALEEALGWSSGLGELPPRMLKLALEEPLVSSSGPLWLAEMAHRSGDDAFARRLCGRALQIDPRRPCAY